MEAAVFVRDKATLTTVMQFIRGKFVYLISTEFRDFDGTVFCFNGQL